MSISPSKKYRDKDNSTEEQTLSNAQQRKEDAFDFAELLYELFVASEASGNISEKG